MSYNFWNNTVGFYGTYSEFNLLMMVQLAEVGRENTAYCVEIQSGECWNKAEDKRDGHCESVSRSLTRKWKWGDHVARMVQIRLRASMWELRICKRRTG
jgi:hypothetical protein